MALAAFLKGPAAFRAGFGQSGWVRVIQSDADALFFAHASGASAPYGFVTLKRENSTWEVANWGGCVPTRQDGGSRAASWGLIARPSRNAASLEALVELERCGDTSADVTPQVALSPTSIAVTMWTPATNAGGVQGCVGDPRIVTVQLGDAVGNRTIVDGGVVPNRQVEVVQRPVDPGEASPGGSGR
jgi:hypothetical protein